MSFWEMLFAAMAILLGLFMGRGFSMSLMLPVQFLLMINTPGKIINFQGKEMDKVDLKASPTATMLSLVFMTGMSILSWYFIYRYRAPLAWWYFGAFVMSFLVATQRNIVSLSERFDDFVEVLQNKNQLDEGNFSYSEDMSDIEELSQEEVEEIEALIEEPTPTELAEQLAELHRKIKIAEKNRNEKK